MKENYEKPKSKSKLQRENIQATSSLAQHSRGALKLEMADIFRVIWGLFSLRRIVRHKVKNARQLPHLKCMLLFNKIFINRNEYKKSFGFDEQCLGSNQKQIRKKNQITNYWVNEE